MAKIERFEGKVFFEPQAQIQGFQNPSAPDLITPLRQNQQAREQERRNFAEARQAELRLQGEALKQRQMIEKAGGKLGSSVSKNTFAVIIKGDENEPGTGKVAQAKKLNVIVINVDKFKQLYFS